MDSLSDPYTVFFSTAAEEGGTVIGLVACMLAWLVIGILVGRWCYLRSASRQQQQQQTTQKKVTVAPNSNGSSDATSPTERPTAPLLTRRERAKALEEELKLKKQSEEEAAPSKQHEAAVKESNKANGDEDSSSEDWSDEEEESETDSETAALEELRLKMVLIVRKDEPMMSAPSIATKAAQAALAVLHTTFTAYQGSSELDSDAKAVAEQWWQWYLWWNQIGVAKITLKCPDRQTLIDLHMKAVDCKLPCALVEGDILAVGPAPSKDLDVISGTLKLLN